MFSTSIESLPSHWEITHSFTALKECWHKLECPKKSKQKPQYQEHSHKFCSFLPIFTTDISSQRICFMSEIVCKILSTNKPGQKALISIFFCSTFLTHANYHKQRGEHSHGNKLLRCLVHMHSVPAWWFLCLKDMSWNLKRNNNNRGGINIHIYIYKLYNTLNEVWKAAASAESRHCRVGGKSRFFKIITILNVLRKNVCVNARAT